MSLVEFFFNSDYRESIKGNYQKKEIIDITPKESEAQKQRRLNKFHRDYHLKSMQHNVDLLSSEIWYGFIDPKQITKDKFILFLKQNQAKEWTFNVLWENFLIKHNL